MPFDLRRVPYYLSVASVAAMLCSVRAGSLTIAASVLALAWFHFRYGDAFRFPPVKLPLGLFFTATVAAVALSGHPLAQGWPGIRKFYLCFILLTVISTFRGMADVRKLAIVFTVLTTLSALWSMVQFVRKMGEAAALGRDFRVYYTGGDRITGFMSHWMTLSGQEMMVLLMLTALLLFGGKSRARAWLVLCAFVIAISLIAGYTRSMWMGAAIGGAYLVWMKDRRWLLLAPVPVILLLLVNPAGIGGRIVSIYRPQGDLDSNRFRAICRRTAVEMIRAHPWFGLGPEQVKMQFAEYIPADIQRPLPPGAYIHLHNVYLQYAAERGMPALAVFIWWLGKMLTDFIRAARRAPDNWALQGAIAAMLAVLAAGWFEHNLGDGEVLAVFLGICACGYVAAEAIQVTPPWSGISPDSAARNPHPAAPAPGGSGTGSPPA